MPKMGKMSCDEACSGELMHSYHLVEKICRIMFYLEYKSAGDRTPAEKNHESSDQIVCDGYFSSCCDIACSVSH